VKRRPALEPATASGTAIRKVRLRRGLLQKPPHGKERERAPAGVVTLSLVITCSDDTEVLDPGEGGLDQMPEATRTVAARTGRAVRGHHHQLALLRRARLCRQYVGPAPRRSCAHRAHAIKHNPHFIITELEHDPNRIHDKLYCPRGALENRIKEQLLDLFADRTRCHRW
jgi:hypothetical protein